MKFWFLLFGLTALLARPVFSQVWMFQSGTVSFSIKNAGLRVNGSLGGLKARVEFDPANPARALIEGLVDVATIETGIGLRDKHLKKEEYFYAEKHPQIVMRLVGLEGSGTSFSGSFSLQMKGVTKVVKLPVAFQTNATGATLSSTFTLNRLDFGIGSSSWTLGDEVKVTVLFRLVKKA